MTGTAQADVPDTELAPCSDLAVIAKITKLNPDPIPEAGPNEIVMVWPWTADIEVEHVIYGQETRRHLKIQVNLHTYFIPGIRHFLIFLRRNPTGYVAVDRPDPFILRDDNGRFVRPVFEALARNDLYPQTWLPSDYQNFLKPIRYSYAGAWFNSYKTEVFQKALSSDSDLLAQRNGRVFVKQGLYLDDMAPWLAQRDSQSCYRPKD
ncbi:MAG TPA: hypothetical protein VIM56_15070 [Rhizomicrobium sp.]